MFLAPASWWSVILAHCHFAFTALTFLTHKKVQHRTFWHIYTQSIPAYISKCPSHHFFFKFNEPLLFLCLGHVGTEAMSSSHLDNGPLLFSRLVHVGSETMASSHLGAEHWYLNGVTSRTHDGVKSLNERLFD